MKLDAKNWLPHSLHPGTKGMVFVDGENLAIRFAEVLGPNELPPHVKFERDTYVWSRHANISPRGRLEVVRRYYYTSVQGDEQRLTAVEEALKEAGIQAPRVFRKPRGRRSKRVDIQLATDMMTHAHRKNFDIAILVAGDEDYVPLVEAVQNEGKRVVVWFFENGLSPALHRVADHAFDINHLFFGVDEHFDRFPWERVPT